MRPSRTRSPAVAALLASLCAACVPPGASPARYYTLSAIAEPAKAAAEPRLAIGIGPVTVAEYLDRPQIVRRLSPHRLQLADNDNWPEPLASHVARILADDLAALLAHVQPHLVPAETTPPLDYRLTVALLAFESIGDDRVRLDARWTLIDERDGSMLFARRSRIERPTAGSGTEAAVAALSEAVALLAREIADGLSTVRR